MKLKVAFGVLAGLVAGASLHMAVSDARASTGGWKCYVVDRLPDLKEAADWHGAKATAEGLDAASPGTQSGTILTLQYPTKASGFATAQTDVGLVCVKN